MTPTNPTLQAELEQVLHTLWLVFYENSTLTSMADTYYIAELEALTAILATLQTAVLAAAPEKKLPTWRSRTGDGLEHTKAIGYDQALKAYTKALQQLFESEQL